MGTGWIGVDFDGTLAIYNGFVAPTVLGEPIPRMVDRVKRWLEDGKQVKIFTARIACPQHAEVTQAIQDWCVSHIGRALEVTNVKDIHMVELWDDRCVQMVLNTGLTVFEVETAKRSEERSHIHQQRPRKEKPRNQLAPPLRLQKR